MRRSNNFAHRRICISGTCCIRTCVAEQPKICHRAERCSLFIQVPKWPSLEVIAEKFEKINSLNNRLSTAYHRIITVRHFTRYAFRFGDFTNTKWWDRCQLVAANNWFQFCKHFPLRSNPKLKNHKKWHIANVCVSVYFAIGLWVEVRKDNT